MKKRMICFLMAVVFALGLVPGASLAANNPEETQNGTEETVETQVPAEESADSIEEGPAIKGEMPTA